MKIAIIVKDMTKEFKEIQNLLGEDCLFFKYSIEFDKRQSDFSGVYCPDPRELLKIKVKIPYIYDISPKTFDDEMNYNSFIKFYSQISGPSAVFVSDKKLNKSANWWGLNSYWVNKAVDTDISFRSRKFLTPKLHIGYIYENKESFDVVKNIIFAKKSNWVFHIYLPQSIDSEIKNTDTIFYSGDIGRVKEEMLSKIHVFLNFDLLIRNTSELFPSETSAESMLAGSVLISSNSQGNNTHIIFDKFNYLKLDFVDTNTILDTLRFVDKRREKLESLAKEGSKSIRKYFDYKEIAKIKVDILKRV